MEAVDLARHHDEYTDRGIAVLGISTDTMESHRAFAAKYNLPYPLLADTEGRMCRDYDAYREKKGNIGARRASFMLDAEGRIEKIWDPVSAETHNDLVLNYVSGRLGRGESSPQPRPSAGR